MKISLIKELTGCTIQRITEIDVIKWFIYYEIMKIPENRIDNIYLDIG